MNHLCQKSVLVQKKMNKHPLLNKKCYKIHKINELRKYFLIQTAIPLIVYKKVKVKVKVIVKVLILQSYTLMYLLGSKPFTRFSAYDT